MKAVLTASLVLAASANLAPPHRARGGKAYELYLEREGAPPTSTDAQVSVESGGVG